MKIRGDRECRDCGARWSYYETGSVACPECDSLHSVGVDERTEHTANPVEFDLAPVRNAVDERPLSAVAAEAARRCRRYVGQRGFIRGGYLMDLDNTYLAAAELRHAAGAVERSLDPADDEAYYLLDLLRGADRGDRPDPGDVPASLRAARGLAYATATQEYVREVRTWLDAEVVAGDREEVREPLGTLVEHVKRVRALDGNVDPADAERLVDAARDLCDYYRDGDRDALVAARERLDGMVD